MFNRLFLAFYLSTDKQKLKNCLDEIVCSVDSTALKWLWYMARQQKQQQLPQVVWIKLFFWVTKVFSGDPSGSHSEDSWIRVPNKLAWDLHIYVLHISDLKLMVVCIKTHLPWLQLTSWLFDFGKSQIVKRNLKGPDRECDSVKWSFTLLSKTSF